MYQQKNNEKKETIKKIKSTEAEIKQIEENINDVDINKLRKSASEILRLDYITKDMYQKLIERIEIDKEKNIYIKFKFAKYTDT